MGFPWQYLVHFRRQETTPFASRPFTHHICPHSTVLPSKPTKAICHPAPCSAQVGQNWCRLIIYSQTVREPLFQYFSFLCTVSNIIYIFLSFIYNDSLAKSAMFRKGAVHWVSSVCHISMQNWTSGHNEQDDFCIHVCYQAAAPVLNLKHF